MKTTAYFKLFAAILLLTACDQTSKMNFDSNDTAGLHTIADLKSRCRGNSTTITEQITVQGIVTGNDRFGEFFKSLVIEDASGGITIAVDGTGLTLDYPVGAELTVYCNGLALTDYGGKIELGAIPEDDSGAGRIPQAELTRYLRRNSTDIAYPIPARLSFDAIGQRHIDTFVCFEGVRFAETGLWCDPDPETGRYMTTERTLIDAEGRTFQVRTLGTCKYANEPLPEGRGSICGIIDYFNGEYTLRITERLTMFQDINAAGSPTAYP